MDVKNYGTICDRRVEFFSAASEPEWGYPTPRVDSFALIHPKDERPGERYALYVVFHSAGHNLYSCLRCMQTPGDHDIYHTPEDSFALVPDCFVHGDDDWWWGGMDQFGKYAHGPSGVEPGPCERRVIDTVKWVTNSFAVDARRVYAVGNSMGGSGALGIALCRGDLFAAIKVNVPAGVCHALERCGVAYRGVDGGAGGSGGAAGVRIPDPPVVVDYSAQNDEWSAGHGELYEAMRAKKYAMMGFFGPFGHENNNEKMAAVNDLIHAFDVGTVRLDEAYPAFIGATTDDALPWRGAETIAQDRSAGQVNAFFRWKVLSDGADRFGIELRLLRPEEWESRVEFPAASVADVAIRRLQNFRLAPGERFVWEYGGERGECAADGDGVPTVERLEVVREARTLVLRRV